MIGRIVDISGDGRHLSLKRGFMLVRHQGVELGRIPLDDIGAVIAHGHGLTYSNNLVLALSGRGAAFVLCGPNHLPQALLWPVDGHHMQNARMRAQLAAPRPLAKRLWQRIVRAKITQQGAIIGLTGGPAGAFGRLARKVRSGDPDNVEAQAARRYWPLLFGADFRRERTSGGLNGLLNYGYAILRSATARAVMAVGLHPTLGLQHANRGNAMCLVDDLMEPFRPLVDILVWRLRAGGCGEVDDEAKQRLAELVVLDLQTAAGATPLGTCLERLAQSLARSFEERTVALDLPLKPLPLDFSQTGHQPVGRQD